MARQTRMPGTEPTVYPDVNKAAEDYLELRQAATNAADGKKRGAEHLINVMKKRKLTQFRDPVTGFTFQIDGKESVKVVKPQKKKPQKRRGRK